MKDLVAELGKALELQARARARLRLTPAALHAHAARRTRTPHAVRRARTARAPHAHRTRTARAPQEIKYVNPANEIGEKAQRDFAKWQQNIKKMTPPKPRSVWRPAAQRRRPNSGPQHAPVSARPS
jgi:hypothetical protein